MRTAKWTNAGARGYPPRESDFERGTPAERKFSLNFSEATRASREVCPKHRNSRRENLRVRFRFRQATCWRAKSGNVFCSFAPALRARGRGLRGWDFSQATLQAAPEVFRIHFSFP